MPASLDELVRSPFARLTLLLEGISPGAPPIDLSLGEPKALIPSFLGPTLQDHLGEFGRYPPIKGIPSLRNAIAVERRRYPVSKARSIPSSTSSRSTGRAKDCSRRSSPRRRGSLTWRSPRS
jgi:aspartate/methionine/tyrosine aminotransferase